MFERGGFRAARSLIAGASPALQSRFRARSGGEQEMDQLFYIAGAAIFGFLGTIHLLYTFFTNKFDARDPAVTEAMKGTSPVLTAETSVWGAWVGFNASHSLGAILFACIYIPLAGFHIELLQSSLWFSLLPVFVGIAYLALAKRYWFRVPFLGILIATVCFLGGAVFANLSR